MADFHEHDAAALSRRNRELSILNSIAEALNRSLQLDEALRTALALVGQLLSLHTGWVWLLREDSAESYLAAAYNLPPVLSSPAKMEGSCYCLDTFSEGDLSGAANISVVTCTRLRGLSAGTDGLRYHASIPLYAHGRKLGVFNVASADWCQLSDDDLRLLHTVGDLLGMAVERAQLFARSTAIGAVEERNRLARELHDTLAQGLAGVLLQLETADLLLELGADTERVRQKIHQALALTRGNLDEARRSVLDLRAAPLEGRTFAEALQALADAADQPFTLSVQLTGALQPLPARIEAGLYRIVQEALNNVRQHAQASAVALEFVATPAALTLTIEDDGVGFDPTAPRPNHYGLIGLNERARLLGGTMTVQSAAASGTRITVAVALQ
ncbi:MAG: GAF domain-containing sensor histidine kinase [Herpetosiphonaceae bacterium]|nr:GAF domain-containing sensor histidine kinase [Herpetosiphonaceae bacterium]